MTTLLESRYIRHPRLEMVGRMWTKLPVKLMVGVGNVAGCTFVRRTGLLLQEQQTKVVEQFQITLRQAIQRFQEVYVRFVVQQIIELRGV